MKEKRFESGVTKTTIRS